MKISPTDNGCGAEVDGIDLLSMSDDEVEAVADAQAAYGVVFFRGQSLTADGQLAAARRFGPINVNRFFTPVPEQPQVAMVLKEPHHEVNVGGGWHTELGAGLLFRSRRRSQRHRRVGQRSGRNMKFHGRNMAMLRKSGDELQPGRVGNWRVEESLAT